MSQDSENTITPKKLDVIRNIAALDKELEKIAALDKELEKIKPDSIVLSNESGEKCAFGLSYVYEQEKKKLTTAENSNPAHKEIMEAVKKTATYQLFGQPGVKISQLFTGNKDPEGFMYDYTKYRATGIGKDGKEHTIDVPFHDVGKNLAARLGLLFDTPKDTTYLAKLLEPEEGKELSTKYFQSKLNNIIDDYISERGGLEEDENPTNRDYALLNILESRYGFKFAELNSSTITKDNFSLDNTEHIDFLKKP